MVWFEVLNRAVYDGVISRLAAPRTQDIVIVAIDDASLHRHGPWPWHRAQQAALIDAINAYDPSLVALDIVYAGRSPDDRRLVTAAGSVRSLALPMMVESLGQGQQNIEVLPFPDLLATRRDWGRLRELVAIDVAGESEADVTDSHPPIAEELTAATRSAPQ